MSSIIYNIVPGYTKTKAVLSHSVDLQHVSHSYIFNSLDGLPSLQMALAFAQNLFCESEEIGACGNCYGCQATLHLNHPDLHFSFPFFKISNKETSCDHFMKDWLTFLQNHKYFTKSDWRDVIESGNKQLKILTAEGNRIVKDLSLKPFKSRYKVLILWQPESLHDSTANKLLKFIEEPDPNTVIILVTHQFDKILPTIQSRCQTFTFEPISESVLSEFVSSNGYNVIPEYIKLSNGNIGQYFRLTNNDQLEKNRGVKFLTWLRACYSKELLDLYKETEAFSKMNREDQKNQILSFIELIRIAFNYEFLEPGTGTLHDLTKLSPYINEKNIAFIQKELENLVYHLERNIKPNLAFFDSSIKIKSYLPKPSQ